MSTSSGVGADSLARVEALVTRRGLGGASVFEMRPGLRAAKKHAARACAAAPTLFTLPNGPTHHALGFLDARDLAAVQTVSLSARASCGTEPHTEFSAHWRASLRVGDRLDARDCESRWFEAEVVGETRASGGEPASEGSVRIHFKGWATSFDQEFSRASPDLVPLFSHSTNWRPKLRKGKLIEGKKGKCWFLALITRIERAPGAERWTALDGGDWSPPPIRRTGCGFKPAPEFGPPCGSPSRPPRTA